jgi:hypothetical protein
MCVCVCVCVFFFCCCYFFTQRHAHTVTYTICIHTDTHVLHKDTEHNAYMSKLYCKMSIIMNNVVLQCSPSNVHVS